MSAVVTRRAGRREWVGLAVLALPCLLYSMDLTVLNLAVPQLSADLQPSSAQLLWIVDIYGFLVAGSLITMGTLGDRIGRRRLLLTGAAAFGVASVLAAFSTSAEMLIAARALLGVAGATLAPSTLSLIRNMFLDPGQRTVAIGVWIASFSAGAAIGPLLGGLLLEHFWWGSVFLIARAGDGAAAGARPGPAARVPRPRRGPARPGVSAALSLAAVLAVDLRPQGAGPGRVSAGGRACRSRPGLASGWRSCARQRRLTDPLLDLRLFAQPRLQRRAGHQHPRLLRRLRRPVLHRPVPPAGAGAVAAGGGAVAAAVLGGAHRRVDAGPAAGPPGSALAGDGWPAWSSAPPASPWSPRSTSTSGLALLVTGSVAFSAGPCPARPPWPPT